MCRKNSLYVKGLVLPEVSGIHGGLELPLDKGDDRVRCVHPRCIYEDSELLKAQRQVAEHRSYSHQLLLHVSRFPFCHHLSFVQTQVESDSKGVSFRLQMSWSGTSCAKGNSLAGLNIDTVENMDSSSP